MLMVGRLIGIEKHLGVRPFRIRNTCRCFFEKCVLAVAGPEANKDCETKQLCGGLDVGIEGVIHETRLIWNPNFQEEEWDFSLTDVHNAFNEEKWTNMLC